ncbi:MAG: hypothetical protein AB8F95_02950 [Bacteroidia bacterium]
MKSISIFSLILTALLLFACSPQKSNEAETAGNTTDSKPASTKPANDALIITAKTFRGITLGDKIDAHSDYVAKDILKTGEGDFDIFRVKDANGNSLGYIMPDPGDENIVGDITVESPMATTVDGIKVGMTWADLLKAIPGIEVHGSEIEGRTYARHEGIMYRLDSSNYTYELDPSKVALNAAILEIVVWGK